jgi:hypothetical protein
MTVGAPLSNLLGSFETDPFGRARLLRQMYESDPENFINATVEQLAEHPDGPGARFLLAFLDGRKLLVPALIRLGKVNREAMGVTARELQRCDGSFDLRLARQLVDESTDRVLVRHPDFLARLELLGCVLSGAKLAPLMLRLLQLSDRTVTSKAALLLGRVMQSPEWFVQHLTDPNPRMRANLVEALWHVEHFETRSVFDLAAKDRDQRVAANAWLGLYRRGESRSLAGLARMARRPENAFRSSAAWAISQTADPRFARLLEALRIDADVNVRGHAETAVERIAAAPPAGEDNHSMQPFGNRFTAQGAWEVDVTLDVAAQATQRPALAPVHYQLWCGGAPVLDYSVRRVPTEGPMRIGWLIPSAGAGEGLNQALQRGLSRGMKCVQHSDCWAVVGYDAGAVPTAWQSWNGTILHAQAGPAAAAFSPSQGQEWMPLADDARNFEAILRTMNGFAQQPDATWGLRMALAGLAGANARRHLCWVLPAKLLLDGDELKGLTRRVELCRAAIHVYALPGVPPATVESVRALVEPTGGAWYNLAGPEEMATRVEAFGLSTDAVHRITLAAGAFPASGPLEIRLRHPEIVATCRLDRSA